MVFGKNKKNKGTADYKNILFISAPISSPDDHEIETYDYFAGIASELAMRLHKRKNNVDLVLKVPNATGPEEEQIDFMDKAVEKPHRYECIILSPVDRRKMFDPMVGWIKAYASHKIIMIDQGYTKEDYKIFHNTEIGRPLYVQADWPQGGMIAAESMYLAFERKGISFPHVVLLGGHVGSKERIQGFNAYMAEKTVPGEFVVSTAHLNGQYTRKRAKAEFEKHLQARMLERKAIDGVFATNDEMALGVRDAFNCHREQYLRELAHVHHGQLPIIVGFDGIREVTRLIDNRDPKEVMYDTVDVRIKDQIDKMLSMITNALNNVTEVDDDHKWYSQPCRSYRKLKGIF